MNIIQLILLLSLESGIERLLNSSAAVEISDLSQHDFIPYVEPPNYCDQFHQLGDMVIQARQRVFHQDMALDQLELALNNETYNSIALVGSPGVGKSLTALVLRENFPWPENVKTLSWRDSPHLSRIESMLNHIDQCGQTMVLIDDMTPQDVQYAAIINKMILERKDIASGPGQLHLKQITVVFIFTVNRNQTHQKYDSEVQELLRQSRTHVIVYDALKPSHLKECFRRKETIGHSQLEEITRNGAVELKGCKALGIKGA